MYFITGALAVRVFLCFASAYLLSYAFRSVNAVIAPALLEDIGLSNADLGLLSAAYFLAFSALQLPLGIWLDKYGPRKTEAALLLFAAVGAAIFASSASLPGLWFGRALIGVGVSACLMASFKAYRQWFAPERQGQLASWMLVAGTSGALAATVPVSLVLPLIGWRGVFWIMSGMIVLSAAAIFFLLKKVEAAHPVLQAQQPEQAAVAQPATNSINQATAPRGYRDIFGNRYFQRMALVGGINHGSFVALQTLWAGPWMMTVLGMSKQQTAHILFIVNLCLMLAYLGLSWCSPRYVSRDGSRGWPTERAITAGLAGALAAQAGILLTSASWSWALWIMLAAFITVTTLIQTEVSLSFPAALAGRANSAYNLMLFIGAFAVQWGFGLLIDAFKAFGATPSGAMRAAFAFCLAGQTAALFVFIRSRSVPDQIRRFSL